LYLAKTVPSTLSPPFGGFLLPAQEVFMEITKAEFDAIKKAVNVPSEIELLELNQLDLALVGGGSGAVSLG
jgi:hypothetical protein